MLSFLKVDETGVNMFNLCFVVCLIDISGKSSLHCTLSDSKVFSKQQCFPFVVMLLQETFTISFLLMIVSIEAFIQTCDADY